MNNLANKFSDKLQDLVDFWEIHTAPMTQVEIASAPDINIAMIDPVRVKFYLQVINRLPKFKQILKEYNLGSNTRSSWYSAIRDINSKGKYINTLPDYRQRRIKKGINTKLKQNPLTEKFAYVQNNPNPGPIVLDLQTSTDRLNIEKAKDRLYRDQAMNQNSKSISDLYKNTSTTLEETAKSLQSAVYDNENIQQNRNEIKKSLDNLNPINPTKGGELGNVGNFFSDKNAELHEINDKIYENKDDLAYNKTANVLNNKVNSDKYEELLRQKDTILDSINEHPIYGLKEQKTTTTDVAIFCALTYIIRGISLYLVDWALTSAMISTLAECFFFYIVVYWIIFGVMCILVNTNIEQTDGGFANPFKAIIFYLNTDINSSVRIWVHLLIQFILFPILIFISDGSEDPDRNSYQKQKSILFLVSNLSLLMWFLSSIIAFRI